MLSRSAAMPLGLLLWGVLTENLGTFIMMIGLATTQLITTMSMAFIPAMKEMNRKPQASSLP